MRAVNSIQLSSVGVMSERELMRALPSTLVRSGGDMGTVLQHTVQLLEGTRLCYTIALTLCHHRLWCVGSSTIIKLAGSVDGGWRAQTETPGPR
jgi:hypothetical protein